MAKNRNKNKDKTCMDTSEITAADLPQAMDTSETVSGPTSITRKIKGVQMKRTKNMRKMKAIAKAISKTEKASEKVAKHQTKKMRSSISKVTL